MSNYIIRDGELYHYGRKGMKWGQNIFGKVKKVAVRTGKHLSYEAKVAAKGVKRAVKTANEKRAAKNAELEKKRREKITDPKKLTDDELKARIKRLELEISYKQKMKDASPVVVERGKKAALDIVESTVKNVGTQALVYLAGKGVNVALNRIFNDEKAINPKKGQKD